jgi:hypothetical protein
MLASPATFSYFSDNRYQSTTVTAEQSQQRQQVVIYNEGKRWLGRPGAVPNVADRLRVDHVLAGPARTESKGGQIWEGGVQGQYASGSNFSKWTDSDSASCCVFFLLLLWYACAKHAQPRLMPPYCSAPSSPSVNTSSSSLCCVAANTFRIVACPIAGCGRTWAASSMERVVQASRGSPCRRR